MAESKTFIIHAAGASPFKEVPLALTGLPKEEAGLPVHYLRKEVIPIGVTPSVMRYSSDPSPPMIVAAFAAMSSAACGTLGRSGLVAPPWKMSPMSGTGSGRSSENAESCREYASLNVRTIL